jgi:ABC-2 type transport system ATP-binding protein
MVLRMAAETMIQARGLVKKFGDFEAVRGIDLDVQEGEVFGFLGPNGAGKSTTISILCTLLKATAGEVRVAGLDVGRHPDEVRAQIGLVFQDPSLDDQLTARENLQFHGFVYGLPAKVRAERIEEVLHMVQLEDRADTQVRTFSGGMKRRLEIARGVMHYPEVLFLDEPTLGLDPQTRKSIWEYLHALRKREGVTLFMTTHYMEEAEFCDRIAIIDHGAIVAGGTPDELKSMVGGDVITITSDDGEALVREIEERFELTATRSNGTVRVEVPDGGAFLPRLTRELSSSSS